MILMKNNEKTINKTMKTLKKKQWFSLVFAKNIWKSLFLKVFIDFHWFGEDRAQKGLEINIDLDDILDHPKRGQVPRGQEINIDLDDTLEVVFVVSG